MAKIRLNKQEAARRQVNAAIRMLYANEDPVAIHTLAMAGFRILRDLASSRSDSYMENVITLMIRADKRKEFWTRYNGFSNFLKHADKDPDGIHDGVDETVNDFVLVLACFYFQDLGNQFTPEMSAHMGWFSALNPSFLFDNAEPKFKAAVGAAGKTLRNLSRKEQLAFGNEIIALARGLSR